MSKGCGAPWDEFERLQADNERLRGLLRRVSQGGYPWGMAQLVEEIDAALGATVQPEGDTK